ncbi:MAG: flagellar filament capping protein FliD [Planctomycetes bacterium]|nr:flagellar filament capping protein FliD [Planctomycetota bacterium]
MSTIALPGLLTGIDTQALVQQLVSAARRPVTQLQARQGRWEARQDAIEALKTRLDAFKDTVADIRHISDLQAYHATSNDESTLTVAATSGASEGAHDIAINQLAAAEREVHAGVATADTLVGIGVLAYVYEGQTRTVQTTAETTLEGLRDLINNDGGNPGVSASILEYDAGGGAVYHLVLGGDDTGAVHSIAIDAGQTTLDGTGGTVDFRQETFTETQSAQDALVRVDGYPAGQWIARSTNSIDDILPGVTLDLHATTADGEAVRVSLHRDTEGLKAKITDLVDSYNAVVDYIQEKSAYDAATKTAGILMAEYSTTYVRRELRLPIIEAALGFEDGSDAYTLAGQIGLSLDRTGRLELDTDVFDEALADDYLGMLNLLAADRTGASGSDDLRFYAAAGVTAPGTYDVRATFALVEGEVQLVSAQVKLASEGDGAWREATVDGNLITGAEGHPEYCLQVTASSGAEGTVETQVRVRQGVAGRLYDVLDNLLDSTEGTLTLVEQRCRNAIDALQGNIDRQEDRIRRLQASLTARFARLEQALTLLEAQRGALGGAGL